MDINIGWVLVNAWASVAPWLFGALVYIAAVSLICLGVHYIFGWKASTLAARILLLPIYLVALLVDKFRMARNNRLLWEEFQIDDSTNHSFGRHRVNNRLRDLGEELADTFVDQEITRKLHPSSREKLLGVSNRIKRSKKTFWRAHRLAQDNGFYVRAKYEDYVSYEKREALKLRFQDATRPKAG